MIDSFISGGIVGKKQYPKIMSSEKYNVVVLFSYEQSGVVIHSNNEKYNIGFHESFWNMSTFVDCNQSITLQNE